MIYAEDESGLEYNEDYDRLEPSTDEEIAAFTKMEDELEDDDKWSAIIDRESIKKTIDEFLVIRNKIKETPNKSLSQCFCHFRASSVVVLFRP